MKNLENIFCNFFKFYFWKIVERNHEFENKNEMQK